jgi:hypothetical protein
LLSSQQLSRQPLAYIRIFNVTGPFCLVVIINAVNTIVRPINLRHDLSVVGGIGTTLAPIWDLFDSGICSIVAEHNVFDLPISDLLAFMTRKPKTIVLKMPRQKKISACWDILPGREAVFLVMNDL